MAKGKEKVKEEKKGRGQPTKYNDDMPDELIRLFSEGDGRESFCAKNNISETTFDNWLDAHPEFAEAYPIAQAKAKHWFNELAKKHLVEKFEGDKLNTKLWSMQMRNRFDHTEHRKLKIAGLKTAENFAKQMEQIMQELANGNLTGSEAAQLAKLVETGVKVYENTVMEKRLSEVEKANRIGVSEDEFKEESNGGEDTDTEPGSEDV